MYKLIVPVTLHTFTIISIFLDTYKTCIIQIQLYIMSIHTPALYFLFASACSLFQSVEAKLKFNLVNFQIQSSLFAFGM
jgi:hypothetical protein